MTNILLCSDIKPISHVHPDFLSAFEEYASKSQSIKIASGYISTDSIVHMRNYLEQLKLHYCELLVGMHHFDGITKPQYDSLVNLNKFLRTSDLGQAAMFTAFPFHGKMYLFSKRNAPFAALIGSSNITALEGTRQFEIDIAIEQPDILMELEKLYEKLRPATKPVHEWTPGQFKDSGNLLSGCKGVEKIPDEQKNAVWATASSEKFSIPLKSTPKSNLNPFFGKGRENMRTHIVRPRPWYEVELIVPKSITSQPGYPNKETTDGKVITVFTDDGWKFKCKISGDYSKNFRSEEDLKTLGRWIKGRLEYNGVLIPGNPVTDETLKAYGRNTIDLIGTSVPDVWLLRSCQ